jgi:hypothetical protein
MNDQNILRIQLLEYLEGDHAHKTLDEAVKDFPAKMINSKPENVPYTFWQLLEHIRVSQHDILLFIHDTDYKYMDWPKDYWPGTGRKADKVAWDKTILDYRQDLKSLKKIIKNPKADLLAHIPHGEGQTIFHEAVLVIDHTAYHVGEFILMRRIMGIWKE